MSWQDVYDNEEPLFLPEIDQDAEDDRALDALELMDLDEAMGN